jgi:hypothetical protein
MIKALEDNPKGKERKRKAEEREQEWLAAQVQNNRRR